MSRDTSEIAFGLINSKLQSEYEDGRKLYIDIDGRPSLHILRFRPLACEYYGLFRNRGPHIVGLFALRSFLTIPHPSGDGGLAVAASVEVDGGNEGYGFWLNTSEPDHLGVIERTARFVGLREIQVGAVS